MILALGCCLYIGTGMVLGSRVSLGDRSIRRKQAAGRPTDLGYSAWGQWSGS